MLAFTKIGLMPDGGASALVAAAVGRIRAMRMALLPERLPAAEALDWGLVSAVYPAENFDAEVDKVIAEIAGRARRWLRQDQGRDQRGHTDRMEPALEREFEGQSGLLRAPRLREGTKAFQEQARPGIHRLLTIRSAENRQSVLASGPNN